MGGYAVGQYDCIVVVGVNNRGLDGGIIAGTVLVDRDSDGSTVWYLSGGEAAGRRKRGRSIDRPLLFQSHSYSS
jgi:hypothetical protein